MPFMNRLSMDERQSIIGLLHLRWPERRIARETGFHRATIRRIARELAKAQSVPEVATDLPSSRSSCEPHRSFIEAEAAKGRNAVAIYQDSGRASRLRRRVQRGKAFRWQAATGSTESQLPV